MAATCLFRVRFPARGLRTRPRNTEKEQVQMTTAQPSHGTAEDMEGTR